MAVLFVGWGIFFTYCLLKFRSRSGHAAAYSQIKAKPSKYAEIIVVAIEAFLLIGLSMPVWAKYRNDPPTPDKDPLVVRVVAQQFAWNFHYPGPDGKFGRCKPALVNETSKPIGLDKEDPNAKDDVTTINNFFIPKGRSILVRLSSKDVIHSFAVPLLRVKQDANPGMEIPVWFEATETTEEVQRRLVHTVELPKTADDILHWLGRNNRMSAMADITKDGKVVLPAFAALDKEGLKKLVDAGVTEASVAPTDPINIQCAQLCGLGHYRMMGQMKILEKDAFATWYSTANVEEEFVE
jgi:cytochrome c oxidase subunit 2